MTANCRRCGDTAAANCEDWDCHLGWGGICEAPAVEVGTPVLGETTEGEPITWYVTHVSEDGTVTIGAEKPGA